jgi:hypothetical protein
VRVCACVRACVRACVCVCDILLNVEPAATIADVKNETIKNRSSNQIDEESQVQNAKNKIIRPMDIINNIVI